MMEMGEQGRGKIRGRWGEQEQGAMGNGEKDRRRKKQHKRRKERNRKMEGKKQ